MNIKNNILETIGNTPLIRLNKVTSSLPCTVVAKVDSFNPGNSIKDRMAVKMIDDAEKKGLLKPGGTIIECTSGNTGMGLALVAVVRGYKCIFTTTDKQSKEKADILRAVGAEVIVCPTNVEPEDPGSYYSVAKRLSLEIPNSYWVNQYDNLSNRQAHYESTGPEIWDATDGKITHLVVGAGTGGTVTGTARYLKEKNPNIKIWAIDTFGSLLKKYHETGVLDMGEVHSYVTEGIGEDFVPENYDMSVIDLFEKVSDKDGAVMARRITKEEGIFVGYSAGSAVAGLMQLESQLKKDDLVVVIFHDHGSRYIGKLYNDEWMKERGYLEVTTVNDIINTRGKVSLVTVTEDTLIKDAITLMKKYDITHIPVMKNREPIGTISEKGLFTKVLTSPNLLQMKVSELMEPVLPIVHRDLAVEKLAPMMNKDVQAVLTKEDSGLYNIITQYDVIQALGK
jgi:cystathionine beta-synthase